MRLRRILTPLVVAAALLGAGCGNSGDDSEEAATPSTSESATPPTGGDDGGGGAGAEGGEERRHEFVALDGVPGVDDDSIGYAVIGTRSNNTLGTCILDCYLDGIEAYFAYRNSEGGIYGRELVVAQELDDELTNNQVRALEVVSSSDAFGAFSATLLASGWGDLDAAGIPTYVWSINASEMADRQHIFGNTATLCVTCSQRVVPYAVQVAGGTRVASIGYGISENSKVCTTSTAASIEQYADEIGAEVVYVNDDVEFGLPNGIGPEVSAMKDAGVDFINTCMDLNGMKTLAEELQRQGMADVTLFHPNTYNQQFVAEAGGIFDGDIVSALFTPFESDAPAVDLFLEWIDETGAEPSELAMIGWINADLAYEGLLAAGPELDRASVVAATNRITRYDAGGLVNPIDWTRQHAPAVEGDPATDYELECAPLVRVVDGAFETIGPPDRPWLCWSNETLEWSDPVPTSFEEE